MSPDTFLTSPVPLDMSGELSGHSQRPTVDDGDAPIHRAGGDRAVGEQGQTVDGRAVVEENVW